MSTSLRPIEIIRRDGDQISSCSMASARSSLSKAVGALNSNCTLQDAEEALGPIFSSLTKESQEGQWNEPGGVSALIVACDKGNVSCLEYLQQRAAESPWLSAIIGTPLGETSFEGNTAMHHAALIGCAPGIAILKRFGISALALGSARNSNQDTPLMLASFAGRVEFCKAWHETCLAEESCKLADVLAVWNTRNDGGDCCLSIACSNCRVDVVDFLLSSNVDGTIDYHALHKFERAIEKMESHARANQSQVGPMYRQRTKQARHCIERLKEESARVADKVAQGLLNSENQTTISESNAAKGKSKNRKKKKGRRAKQESRTLPSDEESAAAGAGGTPNDEKSDPVQITTLHDGTTAVRVEGTVAASSPLPEFEPTAGRAQRSALEMFRDRFRQGQISLEVDSVMQALCLNVPMLLYTSHGMAMDLSPSQLDAVQNILERQLLAVQDARAIQERLHTSPQDMDSEATTEADHK